ncbi:hypothetical protein KCU85_g1753, partial [Aureobasidium melanogenum]
MPAKKHKITANRVLEAELISYGLARDAVLRMGRPMQSAEVERLRPLFAAQQQAQEAAAQPVQEDEQMLEGAPPAVSSAADEAVETAATASDEQSGTHPTATDIDGQEAVDRLLRAAESPNIRNDWLLQQPMQPPTAGQMAAEVIEMSSELLAPLDNQTREQLNNMFHEQQVARIQEIYAEQWSLLMTPPEQPPTGNSLAGIPADLHPVASQLPVHLQILIAGTDEYAQRMVLGMPEQEMYRQLYRGLRTRMSQYNQQREQLRRQIELDPLLSLNPYVSNWLQGADRATQQTYLSSDWFHRYVLLLDNNMLDHIQNWGPYGGPPVSVPEDLRVSEQIAMQHNRYTDRHAWLYSAERVQWVRYAMRSREMINRARRNR